MAGLEGLLAPGYELSPETPPVAAEAIGGAMATYIALAPFLGAEEACAVANSDGRRY